MYERDVLPKLRILNVVYFDAKLKPNNIFQQIVSEVSMVQHKS